MARAGDGSVVRRRAEVRGVVQGVGFRPFLHRAAASRGLSGWALNRGGEVLLEVQGPGEAVDDFLREVEACGPPASEVSSLEVSRIAPVDGDRGFRIRRSMSSRPRLSGLTPDLSPCSDCLEEMADPGARRYRYGLISCSSCGPRYTISRGLPYDRERTAMDDYPLCADCAGEYADPGDRRFHAEPLACPACGPEVVLQLPDGTPVEGDPYRAAGSMLRKGAVLAMKGVGGYLLCCDATRDDPVRRLREMKGRPSKPFAVMVADLKTAAKAAGVGPAEARELARPGTPIMLLQARRDSPVCTEVAPGMSTVGLMLPSSPVHHLLMAASPEFLVMTSGNPTSMPIIADDDSARSLGADAFLFHGREITSPLDDSVARVIDAPGGPRLTVVRRARGWVPGTVRVGFDSGGDILAAGGDMKATFALMRGREILPGRPVGDLGDLDVQEAWLRDLRRALDTYRAEPKRLAVDMHPAYHSRRLAAEAVPDAEVVEVQHHHAHLAAVMAESGLGPDDAAVGLIMDGTGWGTDGTIWGGEVLVGGIRGFRRAAHLLPLPMPGGEAAAREPARMAESLLLVCGLPPRDPQLRRVAGSKTLSPMTSSAGRLLDGVSFLLGACGAAMTYEAEAAMLLESLADPAEDGAYSWTVGECVVDLRPAIAEMLEDAAPPPIRAARLHNALADAMAAAAVREAGAGGLPVALGGGCFVNALLVRRVLTRLGESGVPAMVGGSLPAGDGAVAAGQAAVAAAAGQGEGRR
jgi:hydrogenase maturation protein HypF